MHQFWVVLVVMLGPIWGVLVIMLGPIRGVLVIAIRVQNQAAVAVIWKVLGLNPGIWVKSQRGIFGFNLHSFKYL